FLPGANVTRGQVSKMVANAAGLNQPIPSTQQSFMDVPYSNPFWLYSERLYAIGAISGYTDTPTSHPCADAGVGSPCFLWANPVTRGQTAKIVANTFYPNCQTPARR